MLNRVSCIRTYLRVRIKIMVISPFVKRYTFYILYSHSGFPSGFNKACDVISPFFSMITYLHLVVLSRMIWKFPLSSTISICFEDCGCVLHPASSGNAKQEANKIHFFIDFNSITYDNEIWHLHKLNNFYLVQLGFCDPFGFLFSIREYNCLS
jgi:hypothetical protein